MRGRLLFICSVLALPVAVALAAGPTAITIVGPAAPKVTITDSEKTATITVIGTKPPAVIISNPAAMTATVVTPGLPGPPGQNGRDGRDGKDGASAWNDISGKPSVFPPDTHNQAISTVTGLQTALDGKQAALGYTPVNTTDPRLSDARPPLSHEQAISSVTGLTSALADKADNAIFSGYTAKQRALVTDPRFVDSRYPLPHNQDIGTINGLQTVLDGKQATLGYTPVNTTDSRLSDARTPLAHDQAISTITGLQTVLDGKQATLGFTPVNTTDSRLSDARTPLAHSQAISTVTGLQTALDGKEPANANIQTHISSSSNPHSTTASQTGAEPHLGAPDTDGKVLSSTAMGVRMWVAQGAETRSTIVAKVNETPANDALPFQYKKADGTDVFNIDPATGTVTITGTLVIK